MNGEAFRSRSHGLFNHHGVKADTLTINFRTRLFQDVTGFWQHEIHADFSKHFQ